MYVKTGTYIGTGSQLAITGVGFRPDAVWIKSAGATISVLRIRTMPANSSKGVPGTGVFLTNAILSEDVDGFTVDTSSTVNTLGTTYYWIAFKEEATNLKVIQYTGTGATANITGVGFDPDLVILT